MFIALKLVESINDINASRIKIAIRMAKLISMISDIFLKKRLIIDTIKYKKHK